MNESKGVNEKMQWERWMRLMWPGNEIHLVWKHKKEPKSWKGTMGTPKLLHWYIQGTDTKKSQGNGVDQSVLPMSLNVIIIYNIYTKRDEVDTLVKKSQTIKKWNQNSNSCTKTTNIRNRTLCITYVQMEYFINFVIIARISLG